MTVASPNLGSAAPRLPTVAVVVGCFNQAAFIETAIRSVAAQTFKTFDCVVVDDKSDDDSAERIRACLAGLGDNRFRFIERETNGGQMAAMLTGLDATEAPFVAFLDGDDAWYADFLDCHVRAHLSRAGAVAISSSDEAVIDGDGAILAGFHSVFRASDPRREKAEERVSCVAGEGQDTLVFVERGVTDWLWSTTSGMMFRRTAVEVMRPIDPAEIRICADAYLAHAAHMIGGTVRLERVLGAYRLHGANAWGKNELFLGTMVGQLGPEVDNAISWQLAQRLLASAPAFEKVIFRKELVRMLVKHLGWEAALKLHDSNATARPLLAKWAKPRRRLALGLASALPPHYLPRSLRDTWKLRRQKPT